MWRRRSGAALRGLAVEFGTKSRTAGCTSNQSPEFIGVGLVQRVSCSTANILDCAGNVVRLVICDEFRQRHITASNDRCE